MKTEGPPCPERAVPSGCGRSTDSMFSTCLSASGRRFLGPCSAILAMYVQRPELPWRQERIGGFHDKATPQPTQFAAKAKRQPGNRMSSCGSPRTDRLLQAMDASVDQDAVRLHPAVAGAPLLTVACQGWGPVAPAGEPQ